MESPCLNTYWYNCLNILLSYKELVAPFNKKIGVFLEYCDPRNIVVTFTADWWLLVAVVAAASHNTDHWPPQLLPWHSDGLLRGLSLLSDQEPAAGGHQPRRRQGAGEVRQVGHRLHLFINCKIVSWISGNISHSLLTWRSFKCEYFASLKADIFLNVIKLFKLFNSTLRRSGSHVTINHYVEQWNCFLVHTLGTNI